MDLLINLGTTQWFGILELVWVVVLSMYILLEERSPVATVAWILGLTLLPVVGILIYFVFGPRRLVRKRLRRALAKQQIRDEFGRKYVERCREAVAAGARRNEPAAELAELAVRAGEAPPMRARDVRIFVRGVDAFDAIVAAVEAAQHHIHVECYIFEAGKLAERLLTALARRAREGVEVRLLVDALGSARTDEHIFEGLRAAGGHVAYFNPLSFAGLRPSLLNFRTHRKIVVCDGVVGFTGGMNVADGQDEREVGEKAWRDTHVRLEGDPVAALAIVFLEDWTFTTGDVPVGDRYVASPARDGETLVQIVSSGPDVTRDFAIHQQFFAAIAGARQRVYLTTPYFVPDEACSFALVTAARRGVDVRVLLPAKGDHPFVAAAARAFYPPLVAAGVRIHEYLPRVLHGKTLVVDDYYAAVGTANFDPRSFHLNFEVIAAFYDPRVVAELASQFLIDLAESREATAALAAERTLPERLFGAVAKLFAPIL